MRAAVLLVALCCGPVGAEGSHRGWLTAGGLVVAGAGAVGLSVGAYHAAEGESAGHAVRAYYSNGAAPTAAEAATVRWLEDRSDRLSASARVVLLGSGVAVAVGLSLLLLDGWVAGTSVSLSIQPGPGSVRVSGTF